MIPPIAARLLATYGKVGHLLLDPYCGTGTSLLEANLHGLQAIGTDLNPLAVLIATAKTTRVSLASLDDRLKAFHDYAFSQMFCARTPPIEPPKVKNIDYWFSRDVQEKLCLLKSFLEAIPEPDVRLFFNVAFSETVRESSYTRNGEFKLFRMTEKQMETFSPDVFSLMQNKLQRNRKGLKEFLEHPKAQQTAAQVHQHNATQKVPFLEKESVDLVVSSPPYGDSRTTVAYGQFSRLANEWLGIEQANQVDNTLMGGTRYKDLSPLESLALQEPLEKIANSDPKRAEEVRSFFWDYQRSIRCVSETIKQGGYACFVVGNRKVKGQILPTDEITRDFFETQGFRHIETVIRNIPNKRMPSKNSPSNVAGEKDHTMQNEYIVVMRKEST